MKLEAGLWQQQTTQLAMTQELRQAIALLQYSAAELTEFLESKALENPLIQLDAPRIQLSSPHFDRKQSKPQEKDRDSRLWLEQMAAPPESLQSHLTSQARMKALSRKERRIAEHIINSLDTNGYLSVSMEEVAVECGTSVSAAARCLGIVQSLDPAGIGARNLQECLVIQAERLKAPHPVLAILNEMFTDFAERRWKVIAAALNTSMAEIQQAADYITKLNPRPGALYGSETPQYVLPDLIVNLKEGQAELLLFEQHLPALRFQKDYYKDMMNSGAPGVKEFLLAKKQDYSWIARSLQQRRETLYRVGQSILSRQQDFIMGGLRSLKPLTMREVAEDIGMHESTVSRTVRDKYIQTPNGMLELRKFFSASLLGVDGAGNSGPSAQQVKVWISDMIEKENKMRPLSDQMLAEHLEKMGAAVSRRTVAKYREQLHIPSSSKRRRYE